VLTFPSDAVQHALMVARLLGQPHLLVRAQTRSMAFGGLHPSSARLQSNDEPDAAAELRHPTRRHPKDLAEPSGEPSRPARGHAPGRLLDLASVEGRGWASRSLAITGHTTTYGHGLPHPPTRMRRYSTRPCDSLAQ
jgi:hypothetical protein